MGDEFAKPIQQDHFGPWFVSTIYMHGIRRVLDERADRVPVSDMIEAIGGLYETALFNSEEESGTRILRWHSEEEARAGHDAIVDALTQVWNAGKTIEMIRESGEKHGFRL